MVIELESEALKVLVLPEMGGKILQIIHKPSGSRFLKESRVDLLTEENPHYGEAFLPPYAAGFDECFPNISPSRYEVQGEDFLLPDHGELWTQSWDYKHHPNGISLWTTGTKLNYRFAKYLQLRGSSLQIIYELENMSPVGFDYLWSAHPLLEIEHGDELLLPAEIREVTLNWSSNPKVGHLGDRLSWPYLLGDDSTDFGVVQPQKTGLALKLFTDRLNRGTAGLYKKRDDLSLIFSFDVNQIPYLGIWLCYDGWPAHGSEKEYTLALEPCGGRPDDLETACKWGDQQRITSKTIKSWQLDMTIRDGKVSLNT